MMARPVASRWSLLDKPRPVIASLGAVAVVVLVIVVAAMSGLFGENQGQRPGATGTTLVAALPTGTRATPAGTGSGSAGPTPRPTRTPARTGLPRQEPSHTPTPSAVPTPRNAAPNRPADFDLEGQVIEIGFPLRPETRYEYRNNFLDPREGAPDDYNHARVNGDGSILRLHDGIDIYAGEGEPLLAPFSGRVIDPATRWRPWEPKRYGGTIVIVSDEATSSGYIALLVHADSVWVEVGDHVTRGQIVGTLGRTGNAETQSVRAHLHFELRAPFLLDWSAIGLDGSVDAFNPYPSLVKADPDRT
jgi:murein DD-endopeptidase MepM/ murein hydrolase activator NlpD